ncbi:hypothetical protein MMC13_002859 [Lambiella insularis]|nr:hypothetical protein [Lambiella insularis]
MSSAWDDRAFRKDKPWKAGQPSPILEEKEHKTKHELDEHEFTTVTGRHKTRRSEIGVASTARQGSVVQGKAAPGRVPFGNRSTNYPHPLKGQGDKPPIDNQNRPTTYTPPARQGIDRSVAAQYNQTRLALPSRGTSQASLARSAAYTNRPDQEPKNRFLMTHADLETQPTIAGHRGPKMCFLTARNSLETEMTQYKPGMIIFGDVHEPHWLKENMPVASSSTTSACGPVHSKPRPMVVVTLHEKHYVALPCFTHQGRGIGGRRAEEHVSLRDHRSREPEIQQTSHRALLTDWMYPNSAIMSSLCTVHIAYPISRQYSADSVREGYLDEKSTAELVRLYRQSIPAVSEVAAGKVATSKIEAVKSRVKHLEEAATSAQETVRSLAKSGVVQAQLVQPYDELTKHQQSLIKAQNSWISALENLKLDNDK